MTIIIDRTRDTRASNSAPVSVAEKQRAKAKVGGLYKPRVPIYPKLVHGQWRWIKWILLIVTLTIYYVTPWIRWDRPGDLPDQAVLVDFAGRRFYFFMIQLWPQEVYFLTGLLVIAALVLFLVTALFGRLWCGYTCPQTVWTDLYIYVERMFEGDRNARMRLDAAPLSFNKLWRKAGKHAVWLGLAFGTGGAWIFYFHDAPTLIRTFWVGTGPMTAYVSCAILTFTTYVFAGHMREQVCTYMCPWPRIQGAMLDEQSFQVTYRYDRGEPRSPHKKTDSWEGRGDCIDCNQCVVVCPMGIDIRDGSQLECINCGLCIDACNEIMDKVGRPRGLIAYDTDAAVAARNTGCKPEHRLIRPRTLYYGLLLAVVSGLMIWGFSVRRELDVHALRDRSPSFIRLHDGAIRNGYTLKVANRSFEPMQVDIRLVGIPGVRLRSPGNPGTSTVRVRVEPNRVSAVRVMATVPVDQVASGRRDASFEVSAGDEHQVIPTAFFYGDDPR
ncbi:cytochrome c oxidase accessory protein CcoG [uncultured Brevundimonas sp.]|uniref:cytochrome c oxidase accessory protein CcoG n=1 Tax=uncultured Brevundimonas sp. TaxID=213418 RepID=UPI0030ED9136|tara:strand:+ start:97861 stop:99354 length:1494 start_codon:yes stop_codon:yes gene_type:complete